MIVTGRPLPDLSAHAVTVVVPVTVEESAASSQRAQVGMDRGEKAV